MTNEQITNDKILSRLYLRAVQVFVYLYFVIF